MNERGFFTIIGLCLLLIAAISIKGIHEFEANYLSSVYIFRLENELQNIADSALTEVLEKENFPEDYKSGVPFEISVTPLEHSDKIKNLRVKVRGVYCDIQEVKDKYVPQNRLPVAYGIQKATVLLSVASCDNPFTNEKSYCQALAYKLEDDNTVKFINNFSITEQTFER